MRKSKTYLSTCAKPKEPATRQEAKKTSKDILTLFSFEGTTTILKMHLQKRKLSAEVEKTNSAAKLVLRRTRNPETSVSVCI